MVKWWANNSQVMLKVLTTPEEVTQEEMKYLQLGSEEQSQKIFDNKFDNLF